MDWSVVWKITQMLHFKETGMHGLNQCYVTLTDHICFKFRKAFPGSLAHCSCVTADPKAAVHQQWEKCSGLKAGIVTDTLNDKQQNKREFTELLQLVRQVCEQKETFGFSLNEMSKFSFRVLQCCQRHLQLVNNVTQLVADHNTRISFFQFYTEKQDIVQNSADRWAKRMI